MPPGNQVVELNIAWGRLESVPFSCCGTPESGVSLLEGLFGRVAVKGGIKMSTDGRAGLILPALGIVMTLAVASASGEGAAPSNGAASPSGASPGEPAGSTPRTRIAAPQGPTEARTS